MCVCVVPAWHSKGWVHELVKAATKVVYIDKGSRVFEWEGKVVGRLKWGLFVLLVPPKGQRPQAGSQERETTRISVLGEDTDDDDLPSQSSEEEDDIAGDPDWEAEPPHPPERRRVHRKTVLEEDWDHVPAMSHMGMLVEDLHRPRGRGVARASQAL